MTNRLVVKMLVAAAFIMSAEVSPAQYRTTRSEVRELKSRFEELVELYAGLGPMLQQMEQQLRQLQTHVKQLDSGSAKQEAAGDVKELQRRLAQLETRIEKISSSASNPLRQITKLQSEYDILDARVSGLERRLRTLARQDLPLAAASKGSADVARRSGQASASGGRFVGCCPNCGARLVVSAGGAIRHERETPANAAQYKYASAYDYSAGAYEKNSYGYEGYEAEPYNDDAYSPREVARPISSSTRYTSAYRSTSDAAKPWPSGYSGSSQVYEIVDRSGVVRGIVVFAGRDR